MSNIKFSYKLTKSNIYAHFLYRIHPQDAEILDKTDIVGQVKKSVQKANKHLQHRHCNILIFADTLAVIPEQGIGGRCGQPDIINIFIDPNHKAGVAHNIKKWLPSTLAHELYHAGRYTKHAFGKTLGESLVEEGLPTMFEEFMQPNLKVPYAHHLSKKELAIAWRKAKPLLNSEKYNRDDWFYGGLGMKKWTGYSLGYEIVRSYMKKHSIGNPATIVDIDSQKVIKEFKNA